MGSGEGNSFVNKKHREPRRKQRPENRKIRAEERREKEKLSTMLRIKRLETSLAVLWERYMMPSPWTLFLSEKIFTRK